jgi:hypothetical protein
VLVPLDHRHHGVDLPGSGGLDRQGQLGRHRSPPVGWCKYYYASPDGKSRKIRLIRGSCQEP